MFPIWRAGSDFFFCFGKNYQSFLLSQDAFGDRKSIVIFHVLCTEHTRDDDFQKNRLLRLNDKNDDEKKSS